MTRPMTTKKQGIRQHTGLVAPLDIANIDTDAIIPKQFLQKITREGFGLHLFHDWRFLDEGGKKHNPDFPLNFPRYEGASVLLTRKNFGCGSSREHAPWALADFGFKVILAPSFADIFYTNAINNQIVPVSLREEEIDALFDFVEKNENAKMTLDLQAKTISAGETVYFFEIDSFCRHCLLEGLDSIGLTLEHKKEISDYERHIPPFLM